MRNGQSRPAGARARLTVPDTEGKRTVRDVFCRAFGSRSSLGGRFLIIITGIVATLIPTAQSASAQEPQPSASPAQKAGLTTEAEKPKSLDSVPPEELAELFPDTEIARRLKHYRIRVYGWLEGGYTYSSAGSGLLTTAPTPNRFSNQFLFDAGWLIVERQLSSEGWSWGFRSDFYAGADAALLRPLNNFGPQGKRFGTDFRQLYLALHMPLLSKGGIDFQVGRQNVPIGYETVMAPYRTFYSSSYFWISYQVGSTAFTGTWHATQQLDLLAGLVLGYNTVFELRGRAPSYIAKATYWLDRDKKTALIGSVYNGPEPVPVARGHLGKWQTIAELEVRRDWSRKFTQVFQANSYCDADDPSVTRTSHAQGAATTAVFHWKKEFDLNARGEWFRDEHGARTGIPGTYGEATVGLNVMPTPWINLRPEVRGDFGSESFYGSAGLPDHKQTQLTVAMDLIFKF